MSEETNEVIELIVIIFSLIIVVIVSYYIYTKAQLEADRIMTQRRSSAIARKTRSRAGTAGPKSVYTSQSTNKHESKIDASSVQKRMSFDITKQE